MRKRILRDYVLVVTAALLCGFLIFYLVVSNIMMESTKNDLHYTLKTLEALPREELIARDDALSHWRMKTPASPSSMRMVRCF